MGNLGTFERFQEVLEVQDAGARAEIVCSAPQLSILGVLELHKCTRLIKSGRQDIQR
jgi:hypothetical protein